MSTLFHTCKTFQSTEAARNHFLDILGFHFGKQSLDILGFRFGNINRVNRGNTGSGIHIIRRVYFESDSKKDPI